MTHGTFENRASQWETGHQVGVQYTITINQTEPDDWGSRIFINQIQPVTTTLHSKFSLPCARHDTTSKQLSCHPWQVGAGVYPEDLGALSMESADDGWTDMLLLDRALIAVDGLLEGLRLEIKIKVLVRTFGIRCTRNSQALAIHILTSLKL